MVKERLPQIKPVWSHFGYESVYRWSGHMGDAWGVCPHTSLNTCELFVTPSLRVEFMGDHLKLFRWSLNVVTRKGRMCLEKGEVIRWSRLMRNYTLTPRSLRREGWYRPKDARAVVLLISCAQDKKRIQLYHFEHNVYGNLLLKFWEILIDHK